MENTNEIQEIDLRDIIYIVFKHWWILLVAFIVGIAIAASVSVFYLQPVYQSEVSLFVGKEGTKIGSLDLGELMANNQLVTDYREIITSKLMATEIINRLNLDMTVKEFQSRINVTTIKDSRLFRVSFESTSKQLATDVANELGKEIIVKAQEIIEVKNVKIIDRADLPLSPIKPNKTMNTAIGGILGLMLGAFVIFLIEYLDHTVKSQEDVERMLKLSVIGEIPEFEGEYRKGVKGEKKFFFKKKKYKATDDNTSKALITLTDSKSPASEAYRSLRTNIKYMSIDKELKTLAVTSAGSAEGKTTTIVNLAISMAQTGKKVLVIDGDLRKPKVHRYFGLPNDIGLTSIIVEGENKKLAIKEYSGQENIFVMCSGPIPPNPAEIMESTKLKGLMEELSKEFDLVIVDTPPVGQLSDAAAISKSIDGILLVVAAGQTNIEMAKHSMVMLHNVEANVFGAIITKISRNKSGKYYYYKYSNYDKYYYNNEA